MFSLYHEISKVVQCLDEEMFVHVHSSRCIHSVHTRAATDLQGVLLRHRGPVGEIVQRGFGDLRRLERSSERVLSICLCLGVG